MITSTAAEARTQDIMRQLFERRKNLKMSRRAIAAKLNTTDDVVYRWETRRAQYLRLETLIEYAAAVGCKLNIAIKPKSAK